MRILESEVGSEHATVEAAEGNDWHLVSPVHCFLDVQDQVGVVGEGLQSRKIIQVRHSLQVLVTPFKLTDIVETGSHIICFPTDQLGYNHI